MFTTQQQEFASAVEQFCEKHSATAQQREALTDGGRLSNSPEILRRFADLGWLGVSLPVEYGGGGAGMVEECIFLEETARGLAPIHAYGTGLTAAQTYLRHGDEQHLAVLLLRHAKARSRRVCPHIEAVEAGAHVDAGVGFAVGGRRRAGAESIPAGRGLNRLRVERDQSEVHGSAARVARDRGDVALRKKLRLGEGRIVDGL